MSEIQNGRLKRLFSFTDQECTQFWTLLRENYPTETNFAEAAGKLIDLFYRKTQDAKKRFKRNGEERHIADRLAIDLFFSQRGKCFLLPHVILDYKDVAVFGGNHMLELHVDSTNAFLCCRQFYDLHVNWNASLVQKVAAGASTPQTLNAIAHDVLRNSRTHAFLKKLLEQCSDQMRKRAERSVAATVDASQNHETKEENIRKLIDMHWIALQFTAQLGRCFYSQCPLTLQPLSEFCLAIDRFDDDDGFYVDNCCLVIRAMKAPRVKWTRDLFVRDFSALPIVAQPPPQQQQSTVSLPLRVQKAEKVASSALTVQASKTSPSTLIPAFDANKLAASVNSSKQTDGVCPECGISVSKDTLLEHQRRLHPQMFLVCPFPDCVHKNSSTGTCRPTFPNAKKALDHIVINHFNNACCMPNCGKSFVRPQGVNKHTNDHSQEAILNQLQVLAAKYSLPTVFARNHRDSRAEKEQSKAKRCREEEESEYDDEQPVQIAKRASK